MVLRVKEILTLVCLLIFLVAVIQSVNVGELRAEEGSLDAHVHGMSDLTIAIEGTEIEIEFESPAMNIVGFEYQAQSEQDIKAVERAATTLKQYDTVFSFSDTICRLIDSSVNVAGVLADAHDDHDAHDEASADTHSDISAAYHFRCENLSGLSEIKVNLFQLFSGIEEIRTMWLKDGKQGAVTLTEDGAVVRFN